MNNPKNQEKIFKFLKQFTPMISSTMYKALGRDVFKHIDIGVEKHSPLAENLDKYNDLSLYSRNYKKGNAIGSFVALIPNELIFKISDVFMGGSGNVEVKESLTELETNAALKLIDNILNNLVPLYSRVCNTDLSYLAEYTFSQKSDENHLKQLKSISLNYCLDFSVTFDESAKYEIKILIDEDEFRSTLTSLGLLKDESVPVKNDITKMDISLLSDIEIPLTAELGQARIPMKYALELTEGSMIELENEADDDIKIYSNGIEIGTAEIVVVGENFGIRIKQLISPEERIKQLK